MFCNGIDLVKAEVNRFELINLIGQDVFYETISAVVSACDKKSPGDITRK